MRILIIGGSGSGKSEYAESIAVRLAGKEKKLFYLATMEPYDNEMKEKIKRHQKMRKEKGFFTIEQYRNLQEVELKEKGVVLLECMSNLLANELYPIAEKDICKKILKGVEKIVHQSKDVIVVSNDIFSSGEIYGKETKEYQEKLGEINRSLARDFEQVIEVYYKIPIIWKGEEK